MVILTCVFNRFSSQQATHCLKESSIAQFSRTRVIPPSSEVIHCSYKAIAHLTKEWQSEEEQESRKLKHQAAKFLLVGPDLYKKYFTQPLLRCVRPTETDYILREIHEGICDSHFGARSLSQKALRQGYHWPTMMSDAVQLVQTCERYQRTSNLVHTPTTKLTHLASPYPFAG